MLNKCMIIGNLGADPEMRYTANGTAVTNFNVATSRNYTNTQGERVDETEWFSVVAWNRLGETCAQYLAKGRQVYVEGRMQTRSWDGQDGQKRYKTELVAETVKFLGGRGDRPAEGFTPGMAVGADTEGDLDPDDLPF
ncbi:MAG: single-stranded DNA-binding protein [Chloroflexi bacterium]|nr:single-stranded DNA-binding protein [Chloroflexota bacterium]MDA1146928.1 single-stranded DNA-binding protein [Chloroflexota bacterium]MQC82375.1 single-stranded DNA-binding protein [Chloroflexota bacterium]MQC82983.1 single-stranded DNA-binding protein [Chloroflexota bacterium]PKB56530.1 MAG: single-stranded DNA-binding protein [SAR202 cluster bacterium Casp-Chloro-G1]